MGNLSIDNQLFQTSHHLKSLKLTYYHYQEALVLKLLLFVLFLVSLHVTQNRYILYASDLFTLYIEYPNPALVIVQCTSKWLQSCTSGWCAPATCNTLSLLYTGQSGDDRRYLTAAAILLYLCSLLGLAIELVQMIQRKCQYWLELDNYFQLSLYLLTIIFVSGFGNDCWCAPSWQWQIGAFSVFLGWFNFILILKDMPCTAIPINMFISICITFLKLIFLPILLVLSFGIPFYMVFVRTASSYEVS